jgi:hypothetical protein
VITALLMEAASTSETSVNLYQTTRRNNLEASHLHTRRGMNLKSHLIKLYSVASRLNPRLPECEVGLRAASTAAYVSLVCVVYKVEC